MQQHGNESRARRHTTNQITIEGETREIQISVPENSNSFVVNILSNVPDIMSVSVRSPSGETTERIPETPETSYEMQFEADNRKSRNRVLLLI